MSITHYQETKTTNLINKKVDVNSLFFSGKNNFKSFPKEITYDNEHITFVKSGMRYLYRKGQRIVQLFDMSDGYHNYRLQFDTTDATWTLVKISSMTN